jgi:F-type H+-transporting ATPase subunit gamma
MPSLKDIRSRISSVKNTQQITRAMKMVSAAKLRRAQENIVNVRPYAKKMLSVIADIKTVQKVTHPLLGAIENPKRILIIVVTSDRGLCGGFNNSINRYTEKFHFENKSKYEKVDYFFIGRRVSDYFKTRGILPIQSVMNLAREISYDMAAPIAKKCMDEFSQGGYDEVRIIYNEFKSAISQNLTCETLLPIDISASTLDKQDEKSGAPFAVDMIFEPNPEQIIEQLLTQHFNVQVYRCLAESVAAEHAARMTAMENATKNAKEMINGLTLTYNKLRQASITRELIEICSGADAVNTN